MIGNDETAWREAQWANELDVPEAPAADHQPIWRLEVEKGPSQTTTSRFAHANKFAALDDEEHETKEAPSREEHGGKEAALNNLWVEKKADQMLNKVETEGGWTLVESYIDSGAARSVCPRTHCPGFEVKPSAASRQNEHFKTANGARVANEGDRIILGAGSQGELQ